MITGKDGLFIGLLANRTFESIIEEVHLGSVELHVFSSNDTTTNTLLVLIIYLYLQLVSLSQDLQIVLILTT